MISPSKGWEEPGVDREFAVRYRVIFEPERPPPPSAAERAAQEAAAQASADSARRAQLATVPPGAPIGQFLEFTSYNVPDPIKREAFGRMRESGHFAEEYRAATQHAHSDTAAQWLGLAREFPGDRAPVIEAVRLAGAELVSRIEALPLRSPRTADDIDPTYDVLARFGGLFNAAFALREAGSGEFTPELRAILVAPGAKQHVPGVRSDIVRVASYYLQQWAGDAPAPGDPPPK